MFFGRSFYCVLKNLFFAFSKKQGERNRIFVRFRSFHFDEQMLKMYDAHKYKCNNLQKYE